MSKVFRALEKAERERQILPVQVEPLIELIDAKAIEPKDHGPVLKDLAEEIERIDLSGGREESPLSVADPGSFAAEQFRKVKTHIFRISPVPPRCILVTSTVPQEGKTTVAVSVRRSYCRRRRRSSRCSERGRWPRLRGGRC
jgi:Mrp family chromosome partitioning ATPase